MGTTLQPDLERVLFTPGINKVFEKHLPDMTPNSGEPDIVLLQAILQIADTHVARMTEDVSKRSCDELLSLLRTTMQLDHHNKPWDIASITAIYRDQAKVQAMECQHNWVGTEHLLLALLADTSGGASSFLLQMGVTYAKAKNWLSDYYGGLNTNPNYLEFSLTMLHALPDNSEAERRFRNLVNVNIATLKSHDQEGLTFLSTGMILAFHRRDVIKGHCYAGAMLRRWKRFGGVWGVNQHMIHAAQDYVKSGSILGKSWDEIETFLVKRGSFEKTALDPLGGSLVDFILTWYGEQAFDGTHVQQYVKGLCETAKVDWRLPLPEKIAALKKWSLS